LLAAGACLSALGALAALAALGALGTRGALGADGAPSAGGTSGALGADHPGYAPVTIGRDLVFPADYGSHPAYRTEWWYITGWLTAPTGEDLGFQITFFRTRPDLAGGNPSAFTPTQLIIVHSALSDPRRGRLWQDQRVRRAGMGLAAAETGDTHVWADDWSLVRERPTNGAPAAADAPYAANLVAEDFSLQLEFTPTQAPMLNGARGYSRKGPAAESASYYYSIPHLRVTGRVARGAGARAESVAGEAWLDHEWSSEYLDSRAVGWDWIGIDLDDGAALMAFRIRGENGETRWAGGTLRDAAGRTSPLDTADVAFTARRWWQSPQTGIRYPIEWSVRAGSRQIILKPLMDDQENDTRFSTGAIYWEGAVRAYADSRPVGRGYLELTGYGEKLQLR
jgi:predicted secreted hydrolase